MKENEKGGAVVQYYITEIDIRKYGRVIPALRTQQVIITDIQVEHIRTRHPEAAEDFNKYAKAILDDPDFILENRPNTALLLKEIVDEGRKFQLVLRLCVPTDPEEYSNSVITFTRIREKEWRRLLRNKKILYKKE